MGSERGQDGALFWLQDLSKQLGSFLNICSIKSMTRGKATHNKYDSRALESCQRAGRKDIFPGAFQNLNYRTWMVKLTWRFEHA